MKDQVLDGIGSEPWVRDELAETTRLQQCSTTSVPSKSPWRSQPRVTVDARVDIADFASIGSFNGCGGQPSACMNAADVNDNGSIVGDPSDQVYLLNFLFLEAKNSGRRARRFPGST